ncbi:MAG: radical SAM protein [Candidatus Nealsonbacteria bacterium]|nr:radical SAM protein [Candidatus Nealsonbacteria bacterium]
MILLIEPPHVSLGNISRFYGAFGTSKADFVWPPLELMSIAGYLDKFQIKNAVYDAGGLKKNYGDIQEFIEKEKPEMIIFSTSTTAIYSDVLTAAKAKEISKDIITVAVGTFVMTLPKETLELNRSIDVVVYSDDEEIVVKNLIESRGNFSQVRGICYRAKNGEIIKNPPQEVIKNLDELGFPAHDKIEKEIYRDAMNKRWPMTLVMAQRGCVNHCSFCICPALYKYRERSVEHVLEELKWIAKLGYKEFKFVNSGITYNLPWINKLTDEMIKAKLDLTWMTNVRADRLNQEILDKMKMAGCHTLAIGLETASPEILKNVGKNITIEKARDAVIMAKKTGLRTIVYFILGLPGETKETLQKTIDFAKSVGSDFVTMGVAQPLPGTKFYNDLKEKGLLLTDDWSKYDPIKPPVYQYPDLTSKEIFLAARKGYRQFYLKPSYILKRISQIRSFNELGDNFKNFLGFIKRYVLPL